MLSLHNHDKNYKLWLSLCHLGSHRHATVMVVEVIAAAAAAKKRFNNDHA